MIRDQGWIRGGRVLGICRRRGGAGIRTEKIGARMRWTEVFEAVRVVLGGGGGGEGEC